MLMKAFEERGLPVSFEATDLETGEAFEFERSDPVETTSETADL